MIKALYTFAARQRWMLFWALGLWFLLLSGCDAPRDILSERGLSQSAAIGVTEPITTTRIPTATVPLSITAPTTATQPVAGTLTETQSITAPVTAVLTETQPDIIAATIRRGGTGENEYFIDGEGFMSFKPGDFLVVYANDAAGFEFDAAVMYVVDKNPNNLIARTVFQNPDTALEDLAALRVDKNVEDANLASMISVGTAFVGFTLTEGQIRLNPKETIRAGDVLVAVEKENGLPLSPERLFHVDTVSISGEMARATIVGATPWPPEWTLLIPQNRSSSYTIAVNDFIAESGICVRQDDVVKVSATGMMTVGEFVGMLGPEGKEHFQLAGLFPTPIDPIYDIIPEFPHGVLMFRIADPALSATQGWLHYDTTQQFTANKTGCLQFDMNDKDNTDNSGAFSVQVDVNP